MKFYPVNVVGEQHYGVPKGLRVGDDVLLVREPDNPFDPKAVSVRTTDNFIFGYIARDNFVYEIVNGQSSGIYARVRAIDRHAPSGHAEVVLSCAVVNDSDQDCVFDGSYSPQPAPPTQPQSTGLLASLKRLFYL